jgi:hypothetical protein
MLGKMELLFGDTFYEESYTCMNEVNVQQEEVKSGSPGRVDAAQAALGQQGTSLVRMSCLPSFEPA